MTTYGAYDRGLPCKNPNCKSVGKPHPNCRCYGDFAHGGEASFCSEARAHNRDCEYFAEGGPVDFDSLSEDAPAQSSFDDLKEDEPEQAEAATAAPKGFDDLQDDSETGAGPAVADANADMAPADLQAKMVAAAHPEGVGKYETPGQQLAGIGEGISRGIAGEAATLAENKLLGVPLEDIRGREHANPGEAIGSEGAGLVGGLLTGTGEAALATKGAEALANYGRLSKLGAGFLKGAFANGTLAATDEASKMLLGEKPEHAGAAIIGSVGLGGLLGGAGAKVGSAAANKLSGLAEEKMGTRAASWLAGMGAAASPGNAKIDAKVIDRTASGQFSKEAYEAGHKAYQEIMDQVAKSTSPVSVAKEAFKGFEYGGLYGAGRAGAIATGRNRLGPYIYKAIDKASRKVSPPVVLKILSSNTTQGILEALDHAEKVADGVKAVDTGIEGLFRGVGAGGEKVAAKLDNSKDRKLLEDWLEGGGIDQDVQQAIYDQNAPQAQGFAEGGEVQPIHERASGVALHFPEQNIVLQSAKARASNYLNGLRPSEHSPKLAFDDAPDDRQQKKAYKRALDVAAHPLGVLDEIRQGTVEPEHIKHLSAMFPEVLSLLQQKATERITKAQLDGTKPSRVVRQGLSMLLGTPLSAELSPQNIAAAQAVFASQKQKQQQASPQGGSANRAKKDTRPLSKSDQAFLTDDQARETRQQRSK